MADHPIPNLVQGVSQQGPQQRRDSQCESQFDCINSPLDGCAARPPFEVVKVWPSRDLEGAFFTEFLRDGEEYLVGVYDDEPFVINLEDGTDCTVTQTAGTGYMSAGASVAHRDKVRMQPVEDTIFVLNREKAPAMAATESAAQTPTALAWVRVNVTSAPYEIFLTGPASVTASVSGSANTVPDLVTAIDGVNGYTAVANGSVIKISRGDGADFNIDTNDAQNDENLIAFKGVLAGVEKLPARGFTDVTLLVKGEETAAEDDFYVHWTSGAITGVWEETIAPETKTSLDASSMPHLLVNTGVNTFEYKEATWSTRVVGDEDSAKDPSFIGKKTRDLFYHASRLAILTAAGCVWSKSDFPFTYFPDTVQTILADAPIDISSIRAAATRGTSSLDFGIEASESLYLWAQRVQYRVTEGTDNIFKQGTVRAKPSTSLEYSETCLPLPLGSSSLLVPTESGPWGHLLSLAFRNGLPAGDVEVTSHVAKLIPSPLRLLTASPTLRMAFVMTDGDKDALFLWNYLEEQGEFVQSAWNTWRIPGGDILWANVRGNYLRIIQQRPEGVAYLRCNLTPKAVDDVDGAQYMTRLDLRVDQDGVTNLAYDAGANTTSFDLPHTPTGPDVMVVTSEDKADAFTRGRIFKVTDVTGATVTVQGDLTGYSFYCGQTIIAERTESKFYARSDRGVVPAARLTLNRFLVEMADTAYTRIEVTAPNYHGVPKVYPYEGRQLDSAGSVTETSVPTDAPLEAPIAEEAKNATIRLVNDTYLPSYWQTAAYDYDLVPLGGGKKR